MTKSKSSTPAFSKVMPASALCEWMVHGFPCAGQRGHVEPHSISVSHDGSIRVVLGPRPMATAVGAFLGHRASPLFVAADFVDDDDAIGKD